MDAATGSVQAFGESTGVACLFDWKSVSQAAQWSILKDSGIEGAINVLESCVPELSNAVGNTISFGSDEYLVNALLSRTDADYRGMYLLESESGQQMIAQRGNLYDFWISKRFFTKLGSQFSSGLISEDVAEELYATMVDYTRAYVFQNGTWLMWPLKNSQKGASPDSNALMKLYHTTLADVIAQRDVKGYEEIVVWYFAQRLLKLVSALHSLGFIMGGALGAEDVCVSAACIDFSSPSSNLGSRGFVLRNYSSLVDVESYTAGTLFTQQNRLNNPQTIEVVNKILGDTHAWQFEPDWINVACIVHALLHGKELAIETSTNGKFKSKMAPKIFWNSSLWNLVFETTLNPKNVAIPLQNVLPQVDTHIATKGAPLRFQISKLQF